MMLLFFRDVCLLQLRIKLRLEDNKDYFNPNKSTDKSLFTPVAYFNQ